LVARHADHSYVSVVMRRRMRALAEPELLTIPAAFAELGWPGKDVQQVRRYLAEQAAGDRDGVCCIARVQDRGRLDG
jgi:hypothetical protein